MSNYEEASRRLAELTIAAERDIPLAEYTTFRIGGPCSLIVKPNSITTVKAALALAKELKLSTFTLGNGSNLLASDSGFDGMALHMAGLCDIRREDSRILCGAGAALSRLCNFALEHSLSGLEFAFGIPGSVGGAIVMNAGAYGGEIKDVLSSADFLEPDGREYSLPAKQLDLSYRHSCFSGSGRIVLSGSFQLKPDEPAAIRARMDDFRERRRSKQPLEYPSAGSTFKRPEGNYASALIEQCGLKGLTIGGAQVSQKHSGFLINTGGATCGDVLALISEVQRIVFEKTGYRLECEVQGLGCLLPAGKA